MVELAPLAGHSNWALGNTSRSTRRFRESVEAYSRINLNQGWGAEWAVRILGESARSRHMLGEHEEELELARAMIARSPEDGWARTTEVVALATLQRFIDLARRVEAVMVMPEDPGTWTPFSPGNTLWIVAQELRAHGAADSARRYAEAAVEWYAAPTAAGVDDTVHLLGHARALYNVERWAEAGAIYQRLAAINPESPEFLAGVGMAAGRLGDRARAEAILGQLMQLKLDYPFGRPARWAANIAAVLGREDEAVRLMTQAIREGTGDDAIHVDIDGLERTSGVTVLRERVDNGVSIVLSRVREIESDDLAGCGTPGKVERRWFRDGGYAR
jgi:tetratricopeptide (TPR) repeat protein